MDSFGCMIISYKKDFERATLLVQSFKRHCQDQTRLCIVVPDEDISLFSSLQSESIFLIGESAVPVELATEEIHGQRPGYINQELIKLSFWKTNIFKNYLCLDSDGVFIRSFDKTDFMFSEDEPYTVMFDDKELMCQPQYREMWVDRETKIREIYRTYDIPQPKYIRTCHGFQVFNWEILNHMQEYFLAPRNLTYLDLLKISPYEFSWYTLYLVKLGKVIRQTEHFFKLYHNETQFMSDLILGINSDNLSRGYIGLIVNSNFQHSKREVNFTSSKIEVLSYYLTSWEIIRIIKSKFRFLPERLNAITRKFIKVLVKI